MLHWPSVAYLHFQGLIPQVAHQWVTTISCMLMKRLLPPPLRQFSIAIFYCSFVKFSNKDLCVFFPVALLKFQTSVSLFSFLLPFVLKIHPLQPNPNLPYYCRPTRLEAILYNAAYKRLDTACGCAAVTACPADYYFPVISLYFLPVCICLRSFFSL